MQTSQVSNAASALTNSQAPAKQSEADSPSEPFGKILSREVSQRNVANETPRNKDAGGSTHSQQTAKTSGKTSEAKSSKESKPTDNARNDEDTLDRTSALPEELLDLVANLNEIVKAAAPVAAPQAEQTEQTQTSPFFQDSMMAAVSIATIAPFTAAQPEIKPADASISPDAGIPLAEAQAASGTIPAIDLGNKPEQLALQLKQADVSSNTELPIASASDKLPKSEDPMAVTMSQSLSTKPRDFTAALNEATNLTPSSLQPVQQSALHSLQQQMPNTTERLTPRVGTPAWDQALGQKVVWMVAGEQQSASLTLNPPDLGPLQVVLNVSNSQANATFIAAQPEVRQALEAALPKLRDMLGDAGIQLGQASVNSGAPNQQGNFEQNASQSAHGLGHISDRDSASSDTQMRTSRIQPATSGLGLVDTFV